MLRNYLLIAWKVLLRRKAFTFISLFGISITLAVLLILSTLLNNYIYPHGPEKNNQHFLSIKRVNIYSENGNSNTTSSPGYKFLTDNVARLQAPEKMSFFTSSIDGSSYLNGEKVTNKIRKTDAIYWQILDFDYIAGRAFTEEEFTSGQMVTVITKTTAKELLTELSFDQNASFSQAINKYITVNNQKFMVIGVVSDVSIFELNAFSDLWVPYTTNANSNYKNELIGNWNAMIFHSNTNMMNELQAEYITLLKHDFKTPDPVRYHTIYSGADTNLDVLARMFVSNRKGYESGANKLINIFLGLAFTFMLLPSINLINLNISRIMERSAEIGVRKAFGASSWQLVAQFVVENIVVTALGGLLGFIFSFLVLAQIEANNLIPGISFHLTLNVFYYAFGMIFFFGILSGVLPAYKMSKLHPVTALKGVA